MKVEQHFLLPIIPLRISQGDRLSDSFVPLHKFGHRMCLAISSVSVILCVWWGPWGQAFWKRLSMKSYS